MGEINIQIRDSTLSGTRDMDVEAAKKVQSDSIQSTELSRPQSPAPEAPPKEKTLLERCCPCLTIEFFAQYFDVTTVDIRNRLIASLVPFNTKFHQLYKDKPDLYGPFWVYTTLVILIAVAGNLSRYLQMENFSYNFNFIPVAATVLYCMALGLPMALKLLMRFVGVELFNGTFIEVRLKL